MSIISEAQEILKKKKKKDEEIAPTTTTTYNYNSSVGRSALDDALQIVAQGQTQEDIAPVFDSVRSRMTAALPGPYKPFEYDKATEKSVAEAILDRTKVTALSNEDQKSLSTYIPMLANKKYGANNWSVLKEVQIVSSMEEGEEKEKRKKNLLSELKSVISDYRWNTLTQPLDDGWDAGDITSIIMEGANRLITVDEFNADDLYSLLTGEARDADFWDLTLNSAKRGYTNSRYGEESFAAMNGEANEKVYYENQLKGREYQFDTDNWFEKAVSGAGELLGQQVRQWTNPDSLALGTAAVGMATVAGNAGPQALVPEEIITAPAAFLTGIHAGSVKQNLEIEAGLAYNEMLEAGVSEDTAKKIAWAVGGGNAALEAVQLDELAKAYKATKVTGATKTFWSKVLGELAERGVSVAKETAQEVAQEGVTIAGVQAGSKIDTGEWAYSADEVGNRLGETAKSSALSFGVMNAPAGARNIASITADHKAQNTLTANEQAVVDKIVENKIAEAEKNGNKASKAKIYNEVLQDIEKGYISIDEIESVLGGEKYEAYKKLTDEEASLAEQQKALYDEYKELGKKDRPTLEEQSRYHELKVELTDLQKKIDAAKNNPERAALKAQLDKDTYEMVKGDKLVESFFEDVRSKRKYQNDVTKYEGKARDVIQKVIDSGLADDSNRSHEFWDFAAELASNRDMDVELASNEQILEMAKADWEAAGKKWDSKKFDGKTMDAYVNKGKIVINAKTKRALNVLLGHEITHTLEKSGHYKSMQKILLEYAESKGELESRRKDRAGTHDTVFENDPKIKEKIDMEVTADLAGDYFFTDKDFIQHLLTKDKNIFQKAWDEVKYLAKMATGGEQKRLLERAKRAYEKAWDDSKAQKNTVTEGGVLKYDLSNGATKDASALSRDDLYYLLENAQNGIFSDNSYIPLRRNTPEFFAEVVREHSKGKIVVEDYPMAATVEHLRQNMDEEDGQSYGSARPHGFSVDDIITISEKMGDPSYIVLQKNGRYAEVVSFYNGRNNHVVAAIDFADSAAPKPKNYKYAQYMNGYGGGYYNIIVTQYEPDSLVKYLNDNEVVYSKKEMNGKYQVGSGRIVTVTHDTPFIENIVAQEEPIVKQQFPIRDSTGGQLPNEQVEYFEDAQDEKGLGVKSEDMTEQLAPVMSLSNIGDTPKQYGSWNVYAKDILLDKSGEAPLRTDYSEELVDPLPDDFAPYRAENETIAPMGEGYPSANESVGAAPSGFAPISHLQYKYGTIPEGEHPVRDDSLPVSTNGEDRVSRTARTVKGAGVTPDEFVDLLDQEVVKGGLSYLPVSNNGVTQEAIDYITEEGWEAARYRWSADVRRGMASAKMSAVGALLLNNAAKAGDKTAWLEILADYRFMGTRAAQATQALRILKTLAPTDTLYMAEKSVEKMVRDLHLEGEVEIDQDLMKAYTAAKTDQQRDAILTEIQKNVAKQLPSTMMEMWTALRYVNMLGNFKTQIRNIWGNVTMSLTNKIKNITATGLEALVYKASKGNFKRTKSLRVGKDLLRACKADFAEIESLALDGGKYVDAAASRLEKGIRDEKRVFKAPHFVKNERTKKIVDTILTPLEKYRQVTTKAMERGDLLFSKSAYARALAGYLKANGVKNTDLSQCDEALLDEARMYAIKEAQEVTFRDHNALTEILTSKLEERSGIAKVVNTATQGIMPFRQTPANVLLRAEEYSPLGFANALVLSLQSAAGKSNLTQKKGLVGEFAKSGQDITGAQLINSFAKSLTGTGLFLTGMALSNLGVAIGGADEDEKEEAFDKLHGKQNFSLKICGVYYTLDWLSPSAIPFFMGVNLMEQVHENGWSAETIKDALMSLTEPMLQMSMLQGLNDTLDDVRYAEIPLLQIGENALFSYAVQGMTNSLLSHLERGFEDKRYTTYVDKNSSVDTDLQKKLGKNSAKIPGWDYNQVPYINAWGEEEENPGALVNLTYNLFSPGYFSKDSTDDVAKELYRLNEVNKEERGIFPKTPEKTATFTDRQGTKYKNYDLSADEYVALAKEQGQTQRRIVEELFRSKEYKALTDEQKVKAVHKAYDYAREYAQIKVLDRDSFSAKWMAGIEGKEAQTIIHRVSEQ